MQRFIQMIKNRLMQLKWFQAGPRDAQPHVISNRRIYVLPTRFGLFICAALCVLNLGALNYNNNAALLLGFMFIGVCLNSLIAAHVSMLGMQLEMQTCAPVFAEQDLLLSFSHHNEKHTKTHSALFTLNFMQHQIDFFCAQEVNTVQLTIATEQRGLFHVDRVRIATLYPFGLTTAWSYLNIQEAFIVYPTPRGAALNAEQHASAQTAGLRHQQRQDQPHHLREYRSGDSRKQIAWKASARTGQLQVREYEKSALEALHFDWSAVKHLPYESAIEQLCLWIVSAHHKQLRYSLQLPQQRLELNHSEAHFHQCLRALALMPHE